MSIPTTRLFNTSALRRLTRIASSPLSSSVSRIRPVSSILQLHRPQLQHQQPRHYATETSQFPPLPHPTKADATATTKTNGAQFSLAEKPAYELTFTCKPCGERSTHKVSKQGYHKGTILIQCPGCKNRHLIADHLKIFRDQSTTLEDIMKEKGEVIKKGFKSANGDIEILPPDTEIEDMDEEFTVRDGSDGSK